MSSCHRLGEWSPPLPTCVLNDVPSIKSESLVQASVDPTHMAPGTIPNRNKKNVVPLLFLALFTSYCYYYNLIKLLRRSCEINYHYHSCFYIHSSPMRCFSFCQTSLILCVEEVFLFRTALKYSLPIYLKFKCEFALLFLCCKYSLDTAIKI